jgi:hypothetical protein
MTQEQAALWIQVAAVIAAVAAAIIALIISAKDRVNARAIAQEDRAASLAQAKLMFDLDLLLRLLDNRNRGGSTDPQETARMGAEVLTLVGLLGPDRVPRQWAHHVEVDDDGLRDLLEDPEMPDFKKDAIETQLAANALMGEIRSILERK